MIFDLTDMKKCESYENTYGSYMDIFKSVQCGDVVINPPRSWVPLLMFLNVEVQGSQIYFNPQDSWMGTHEEVYRRFFESAACNSMREYVEASCVLRPELVDSLWKIDSQWEKETVQYEAKEFNITTYNSYYRKELTDFMSLVDDYSSEHDSCVITNCSADKPYPSYVHSKLMEMYPDRELLIATGVLGIIPSSLWDKAPLYDSGIPNFWRQYNRSVKFFGKNKYKKIHVFTEFYQKSLNQALFEVSRDSEITFEVPYKDYKDYIITKEFVDKASKKEREV